ncbi:PEP-CTERM system histidine kinase PrsK [soil metagenome]
MLSLAYWGLLCATLCYAALVVWRVAIARDHPGALQQAIAFAGMAGWTAALLSGQPTWIAAGEFLRDIGWLTYLLLTTRGYEPENSARRAINRFWAILVALVVARAGLTFAPLVEQFNESTATGIALLVLFLRWLGALIGIVFANYLYRASAPSASSGFRLILVAVGIMWAYDANLFTLMLLGYPDAIVLAQLWGVVALLLVPPLALAARRKERWKITLSRQAAAQSLLFVAMGSYFVVISTATRAIAWTGGHVLDLAKILTALLLTAIIMALSLMPRLRARVKAVIVRNLFEHRYDYRSEWLRFSATIGDRSGPGLSPEERAVRALTDVTESAGGVLLLAEPDDKFVLAGSWQWPATDAFAGTLPAAPGWRTGLASNARILALDDIRAGGGVTTEDKGVPDWLLVERRAWVGVPLVSSQRLVGIVLLGRPQLDRDLDWEDFDLLKVIAQQVAIHLTDAQRQSDLEEARRFEEFNRRFAFIIHDLKNVVSQLSLVSSNTAEHGANPKFQAAMATTLANATGKMTTLLSRLSSDRALAPPRLDDVSLAGLLHRIAAGRPEGAIKLSIGLDCVVRADADQLAEAIGHLITNAIEASGGADNVGLSLMSRDHAAIITVEDQGNGMSRDFIRKQLFKPFASTKPNGFGIGAAEARALIIAMNGEMEVDSVEGEGTRFSIIFPVFSGPEVTGQ